MEINPSQQKEVIRPNAPLITIAGWALGRAAIRYREVGVAKVVEGTLDLEYLKEADCIVALGHNWANDWRYRFGIPPFYFTPDPNKLSVASMATAAASAILAAQLDLPIIFQTGRTAGQNFLSEAEAMQKYITEKLSLSIPKGYILEIQSWSTRSNALNLIPILTQHGFGRCIVLTTGPHTYRAAVTIEYFHQRLFAVASSEQILFQFAQDLYQQIVEPFQNSLHSHVEYLKELGLMILDPIGTRTESKARNRLSSNSK